MHSSSRNFISIVTVVLNSKEYMEKTLNVIQELKSKSNIEYIVIDGKSTDGTVDLISEFENIIDIFVSEEDTGLYNAMNKGAQHASGSHILFLNAGDRIQIDNFIDNIKNMKLEKNVVYYSDVEKEDQDNENYFCYTVRASDKLMFWDMTLNHPTVLTPTSCFLQDLFNEKYQIAADYDYYLRLKKKQHLDFKKLPFASVVMAPNGVSSDIKSSLIERFNIQKIYFGRTYAWLRLTSSLLKYYLVHGQRL